jgi:hypothetical protein
MKANEFLKLINATIKSELPEDLLGKLDVELPEKFDTLFTANYLTRDRAKSDDEIITEITKKSNKSAFTAIDDQIKELLPIVTEEDRQKINSVFSTKEKVALLKPALETALKNAKGKVTDADIRKVEEEWQGKYKLVLDDAKREKAELVAQMEQKNFAFYVTQKLAGYKLAGSFDGMREHINQMALLDLQSKGYKYEFENGTVVVRQEKEGVVRDVFNGETKVTLESLLDKFVNPFLSKSNAGNNGNGDGGHGDEEEKKKVIKIGPGATLREMMLAAEDAKK